MASCAAKTETRVTERATAFHGQKTWLVWRLPPPSPLRCHVYAGRTASWCYQRQFKSGLLRLRLRMAQWDQVSPDLAGGGATSYLIVIIKEPPGQQLASRSGPVTGARPKEPPKRPDLKG